jgi:hypothetical protein
MRKWLVLHRWLIALLLLSLLGVGAGLFMNRFGVDMEPDSAVYLTSGIHFARGEGMSLPNLIGAPQPMVWFPPVTPWMVSLCEWSGLDIRKSFGVFNAVAWGILIGWVGWLAHRAAGGRPVLGVLAAGAMLTSHSICAVNGFLYSEPPFLLCLMGGLAALAAWWERPGFQWVVVAGVCIGLGLLTRYVGLTLVLLGGLTLLVRPGVDLRRRCVALASFGALSVGPMFGWHLWMKLGRSALSAERILAWHPITWAQINEAIATFASFVVPEDVAGTPCSTWIVFGLMTALGGVAVWAWLGRRDGRTLSEKLAVLPALVGLSAVFIGIYLAFLVVSISIADASTPLDWRILSIIVPPGVLIVAYLVKVSVVERLEKVACAGGCLAALALLVLLGRHTFCDDVCRDKIYWMPGETSPVLDALRTVPAQTVVFSDAPCEIYMALRRKTEDLPHLLPEDAGLFGEARGLEAEIAAMQKKLADGGWVVYWKGLEGDSAIPLKKLQAVFPVIETKIFPDGALLHIAPSKSGT